MTNEEGTASIRDGRVVLPGSIGHSYMKSGDQTPLVGLGQYLFYAGKEQGQTIDVAAGAENSWINGSRRVWLGILNGDGGVLPRLEASFKAAKGTKDQKWISFLRNLNLIYKFVILEIPDELLSDSKVIGILNNFFISVNEKQRELWGDESPPKTIPDIINALKNKESAVAEFREKMRELKDVEELLRIE